MSQTAGSVNFIRDIAIQADGKIVAAGYCEAVSPGGTCLARYNANGSLDTTFAGTGAVVTPIGTNPNLADNSGLALELDGKIVVTGSCKPAINDFCVARYNSNGSLDISFGRDGAVSAPIGASDDIATGLAVLGDGRIVTVGYCQMNPSDALSLDFCLARFNVDGSLDTSFNGIGTIGTPIGTSADAASAAVLQADGKLVLAGSCLSGASSDFCLARYGDTGGGGGGTVPAPPTNLTATPASPTQINLTWSDHSSDEVGFVIERCLGACTPSSVFTQIAAVGANISGYSNTGLAAGTMYSYRVRAYNPAGSSVSNISTATTPAPPPTPPAAPSSLSASALSNQRVQLAWTDNSANETRFEIERRLSGAAFAKIADVAANIRSYLDSGLSRRATYDYRVRACNNAGCSAYSNVARVTTR